MRQDRETLDALYRQRATWLALAAAAYYALLSIAHAFLLAPPNRSVMMGLALATAVGALVVRHWLANASGSIRQVETGAVAIFSLATLNVTFHAILLQSADQAAFLPTMAVGFALLSPSRRVLAVMLISQMAAASLIFALVAPAPSVTMLFVVASAIAGAWFGGVFTLHTAEQLLAQKESAEQLSAELESRVVARTLALAEATAAAESANAAKSQFLAVMSHELRTPLNAIIGYSEIMRESAIDESRAQDRADLDRVLAASQRLLHMINGVLDLAKIEAGRLDLTLAQVDVAALAREALDSVRPAAQAQGAAVAADLSADLGFIETDGFRLSQCLLNLLSNAVKFAPGGSILLTARRQDDHIVFAVKDTGIGISETQAARLFKPFAQADGSTTRTYGGTGLGLAITRELALLLGGDVVLDSKLGEGATFTLTVAARAPTPEAFEQAA